MPPVLVVQNLAKAYGARTLFCDVAFALEERDRVGLVGVNGSGKSTLMRLLAAGPDALPDDLPDEGTLTRRRNLRVEFVPQEPRLDPDRSVIETLRDGLRARLASEPEASLDVHAHEIRSLSAALSLPPPDQPVGQLSVGERRRIAIARALLSEAELLLLDEPTNHLDAQTVEWLEGTLRGYGGALLLVTHDRYFLDRVATRILEVDRGRVHAYDGNYTRFLELQSDRLANESRSEHNRAAFVRRELDWIRRGPQARQTKQQARIERFEAAVAGKPTGGPAPGERTLALRIPVGGRLGKTILEAKGLRKQLGGKLLFDRLDLLLKPGDRIGIVGPNGVGKTTLIRVLLGLEPQDAGTVTLGINTRPVHLDQTRSDLDDRATILDEVSDGNSFVQLETGPVHVRGFLRMMLFDDRMADVAVGSLSGGERNRVQLARLLRRPGNLLVLDEPTNDLDLFTLTALEEALAAYPGCALVVSHDRWFLDKVATAILAFEPDVEAGRVVLHEGDDSAYRARRAREAATQAAARREVPPAPDRRPPRPKERRLSYAERRELDGMEAAIAEAEARVAQAETALADPAFYKDRAAEAPAVAAALDAARDDVERLYARWAELDAIASGAGS